MSVHRPELAMKCLIPVVMAGIVGIYGLVIAILIAGKLEDPTKYTMFKGCVHLGSGLAVGFSGLAAGYAIGKRHGLTWVASNLLKVSIPKGIIGDTGVRGTALQPRLYVGMILILIFAEVLGLYGLIVAIYLYTKI